jgi:4'-phosphopantetheinyl transferase EntD
MIADILPGGVMVEEAFGDLPEVELFPEEEAAVARAVLKRRREFATARACARAALARLGIPPVAITSGTRGAPQWPAGVVGSITHCDGYRACVVARESDVVTIGIDAEPHGALPHGVLDLVSSSGERAGLAELSAAVPGVYWERILFCAKESVYKAWFPLARRWLGFEDAYVDIDPANGTFSARLLVDGPIADGAPLTGFDGRWIVSNGLIATSIVVIRSRPLPR